MQAPDSARFEPVREPETLATAIRIGDPVSWPKAWSVLKNTNGAVEVASEQEIADAKAIIGKSGIGCEPASAATLAGIRKFVKAGVIRPDEKVVAVLTGNVLKDPDYIYRYHMGELKTPSGEPISPTFGNRPRVVGNNPAEIEALLSTI
jgi:threonine synthase